MKDRLVHPPRLRLATAVLVIAWMIDSSSIVRAQSTPLELLRYIPDQVNTVAVINVQAILNCPRAKREEWAKRHHTEYLSGAIPIHPSVERLLVATEFVPGHPSHGGGLAIAPLNQPFNPERLAKERNGSIVEIAEEKAVSCPNGIYYFLLKENLLGAMRTSNPQDVARWIRFVKSAESSTQSRYLRQAVNATALNTHIFLVVDTENLFPREQAQVAAAASDALKTDQQTLDAISEFVGGLRGIRFTADVADRGLVATLRFDSKVPPRFPPELFKSFVIDTLEKNSAMLEDLQAAAVRTDQNTVIFSLQVTDGELARIMSLVLPPATGISESAVIRVAPDGVSLEATARYFQTVNRLIDDLRRQYNPKSLESYPRTAVWHEAAANRIQTMTTIGVDREVVEYGLGTAHRLYEIANSLRGVPAEVKNLESRLYYIAPRQSLFRMSYGVPVALPWGNNIRQIRAQQERAIQQDRESREQLWSQIDSQRAKVRQSMATKYKTDISVPLR